MAATSASKTEYPSFVTASPSKRFFVEMLTRDIELVDAILDLLDNCVDGILRSEKTARAARTAKPYAGHWAKIVINEKKFQIADNCGGIPLGLATNYAFMMGKPATGGGDKIATVGMYGIGMKRAIFKMGHSARITSQTENEAFQVEIDNKWMTDDDTWHLPLTQTPPRMKSAGTIIDIEDIRDGINTQFKAGGSSSFITDLHEAIAENYAFIIEKGFAIQINGRSVAAKPVELITSLPNNKGPGLFPYLYKGVRDGVSISLAVGFYTPMYSEEDIEEEARTKRTKDDAGWTIVCNDRVVLYNDKTRVTGWGEAGVPDYHNQFIGILGVVEFKSNDPWKLPLTTTKRGVNTSSDLYLYTKDFMREGLKKFTTYTNRWKKFPVEERKISSKTHRVSVKELLESPSDSRWVKVRNLPHERKLSIDLALPTESDPIKQIRFSRRTSEIRKVAQILFGDSDVSASEVGEHCFEMALKGKK